ncbi:MAG: FAD-binding protein [Actinophytocola sp.]|uniref:FAD-binding protein n=1 Tax=Actinophytocola sp. TaxID=1872138 RepID=UPI003D6A6F4C
MDANPRDVPPPPLDGSLEFDQERREAAAADFGHVVHRVPEAVLLPGSDDDVAATIRWAAQRGRGFAPQGQRHAVFGRSQVQDGIVADMSARNSIGSIRDDRVEVDAGVKWSEVLAATLPERRTPPVLTEYLELSVGGTIVVGGVGGTTSRYGLQSDTVLEMDVVTGEGTIVTCSPEQNADLFDAMRAGFGQAGVITRATLALVPAPESVRRILLFYPDLATMLTDARLLSADAERFDVVQGAVMPPPGGGLAYRLDVAKYFTGDAPADEDLLAGLSDDPAKRQPDTLSYFDYLNRLSMLEKLLRKNGQWFHPHPWLTTFIGDSEAEAVVGAELDRLDPPVDLGQFGQVVLSPIRTGAIDTPLLRLPADELCHAFNLVRVPTTDDADNAQRLVAANKAMYERVKAAGGVLYPVSAFPLSKDEWREHFGPVYDQLAAAKRKYDPDEVLTPGYGIF